MQKKKLLSNASEAVHGSVLLFYLSVSSALPLSSGTYLAMRSRRRL